MPDVIVIHGMSCSGKSTKVAEDFPDLPVVSSDYYIEKWAKEIGATYNDVFTKFIMNANLTAMEDAEKHISKNDSFVVDRTNLGKRGVSQFLPKALIVKLIERHYRIKHIWMPLDIDKILERNDSRRGKVVPKHVLQRQLVNIMRHHAEHYNYSDLLKAGVRLGLIKEKDEGKYKVLKYAKKVMYKNLWTPLLEECRGLVVDTEYNMVSMGLRKTYNYGTEYKHRIDQEEPVLFAEKINGFMASATWHNGEMIVSTTGTLSSDYAKLAREYIEARPALVKYIKKNWGRTYFFEVVDPSDPHIIEETPGLYFLGTRSKTMCSVPRYATPFVMANTRVHYPSPPDCFVCNQKGASDFGVLLDRTEYYNHIEGFMVLHKGKIFKLKTKYYLAMKALARSGENLEKAIERCEKNFKAPSTEQIITFAKNNIEELLPMNPQARLAYLRNHSTSS